MCYKYMFIKPKTFGEERGAEIMKMGLGKLLLILVFLVYTAQAQIHRGRRSFNVLQYGAAANPGVDSTQAFVRTWDAACAWEGRSEVLIPAGTFIVGPVAFRGPCEGPLRFRLEGVIRAHPNLVHNDKWINFQYLNRFSFNGGGVVDGLADLDWFRRCDHEFNCPPPLPVSVGFDFLTNSRVRQITSLNSKNTHFNVFGCFNLNFSNVRIVAPGRSPNTDGIRIGKSDSISLSRLSIATGDDCISMLGGSRNIRISDVVCGPGHGISVGSLGRYPDESDVRGISVRRSTFVGTMNGVRIKTWASSASSSLAADMVFEDLQMRGVGNPIIIDQQYCPNPPCYQQESPTQVQINNVTFRNIWGTSLTKTAVYFRCSRRQPCRSIKMQDINLVYNGGEPGSPRGPANSVCFYAQGIAYGHQNPPPCL